MKQTRRIENRARLEQATAAYFAGLPADTVKDERDLGLALGQSADEVDFDG